MLIEDNHWKLIEIIEAIRVDEFNIIRKRLVSWKMQAAGRVIL